MEGETRLFCFVVRKKWHHLHNAGKYLSSIMVVFTSLGRDSGPEMWWLWLVSALWSTSYSYFWDM